MKATLFTCLLMASGPLAADGKPQESWQEGSAPPAQEIFQESAQPSQGGFQESAQPAQEGWKESAGPAHGTWGETAQPAHATWTKDPHAAPHHDWQPQHHAHVEPHQKPQKGHGYVHYPEGMYDDHGYCHPPKGKWVKAKRYYNWGQTYQPGHDQWVEPSKEYGYMDYDSYKYTPPKHHWVKKNPKVYRHCANYMVDMARWKWDQHMKQWNVHHKYKQAWNWHWKQVHYAAYYLKPEKKAHWQLHLSVQRFKAWCHRQWPQYKKELVVIDRLFSQAYAVFTKMEHHYMGWELYNNFQGWYANARPNGVEHCEDVWQTCHKYYTKGPKAAAAYATHMWDSKYKQDPKYSQQYQGYFNNMS